MHVPAQRAGKFFSAVRDCPRPCARINPWFRGQILGEKCAQEPTPGSAVKHCRFLDKGGGGNTSGIVVGKKHGMYVPSSTHPTFVRNAIASGTCGAHTVVNEIFAWQPLIVPPEVGQRWGHLQHRYVG